MNKTNSICNVTWVDFSINGKNFACKDGIFNPTSGTIAFKELILDVYFIVKTPYEVTESTLKAKVTLKNNIKKNLISLSTKSINGADVISNVNDKLETASSLLKGTKSALNLNQTITRNLNQTITI